MSQQPLRKQNVTFLTPVTEQTTFSRFFSSSDSHKLLVLATATYPVTHLYTFFKMVIRLPFKLFRTWTQNLARTSGHCLLSCHKTKFWSWGH